jgi:hypothetical protein
LPLAVLNAKWSKLLNAKPDGLILVDAVLNFAAWGTAWFREVRDFPE